MARALLAVLSLWALHLVWGRFVVFQRDYTKDITHMDGGLWLAWLGPAAAAGFLFGLATWLPFGNVRYLWSRLPFAALALVPLAQFWWVYIGHHAGGGLIARHMWFADAQSQIALAVLVGVALASGIRARRGSTANSGRSAPQGAQARASA